MCPTKFYVLRCAAVATTLAGVLAALAGCSAYADSQADDPEVDSLASLHLFEDPVAEQVPVAGVLPYDVIAVLYADEAGKLRFVSIPAGGKAHYDPLTMWEYPDGTRFIKTFFFPRDARNPELGRRLIETRILEREAGVWTGRTYVWNETQTEAVRVKVGATVPVSGIDRSGANRELDYLVPNENECRTCHAKDHVFEPLGPRTREINRDREYGSSGTEKTQNQIDHLNELDLLDGDIPPVNDRLTLSDPFGSDSLDRRARSYLDANCSHCHRPGGEAASTALDLRFETTDPSSLGICRTPVAAGPGTGGRDYDIVPGDPDASVMPFRMASTDPELKMPELPTRTSDAEGLNLIREWIRAMPAQDCH